MGSSADMLPKVLSIYTNYFVIEPCPENDKLSRSNLFFEKAYLLWGAASYNSGSWVTGCNGTMCVLLSLGEMKKGVKV